MIIRQMYRHAKLTYKIIFYVEQRITIIILFKVLLTLRNQVNKLSTSLKNETVHNMK